jgi:hypothetical protein
MEWKDVDWTAYSRHVTSTCEYANEHSDCFKGGKLLDQLSEHQLLKKEPVPRVVGHLGSQQVIAVPPSSTCSQQVSRAFIFHLITLRHTPQSVGLLWTRDRPVAVTST